MTENPSFLVFGTTSAGALETTTISTDGQVRPSPREQFEKLAAEWREQTGDISNVGQILEHRAYREIIALGTVVLPLILHELHNRGGLWFAALREITGVNPALSEPRGDTQAMTAAWLEWGRLNGYVR